MHISSKKLCRHARVNNSGQQDPHCCATLNSSLVMGIHGSANLRLIKWIFNCGVKHIHWLVIKRIGVFVIKPPRVTALPASFDNHVNMMDE